VEDKRATDAPAPKRSDRFKLTDETAVKLFRGRARAAPRWPRLLLLASALALLALAAWSALR
jgi:hypothetical protein